MPILSTQQLFSDNQAITASVDSTNVIDLGVPGTPYGAFGPLNDDVGKGACVPFLAQVTEDFDNLTTLEIKLSTGATTALGTEIASQTFDLADLTAGTTMNIQHLPNGIVERYLGVEYVVVGTNPTTGAITSGITMGNQTNITGA